MRSLENKCILLVLMGTYIDRKFINLISSRLERFAWKTSTVANLRCPYCHDSSKNKYKARGYFYERKGNFSYHCHNCGVSKRVMQFIKEQDPILYKEYLLENFGEPFKKRRDVEPQLQSVAPKFSKRIDLESIESLPLEHYAKKYILSRKIPKEHWKDLYFAQDFKNFVDEIFPENGKSLHAMDPRIVIPFYDLRGELVAFTGRSLQADAELRYILIKLDESAPRIFGLNRVDFRRKTYVVEGPIDSFFLNNTIAAAGSNLVEVRGYIDPKLTTFIMDNQPRNKDVVATFKKVVDEGFRVFVWPNTISCKDINDLILSGWNSSEIEHMIDTNTFQGLEAQFKLQQWRK